MSYSRDSGRSRGPGAIAAAGDRRRHLAAQVSRARDLAAWELTRGSSRAERRALASGRMRPVISGRADTAMMALGGAAGGNQGKPGNTGKPGENRPPPRNPGTGAGSSSGSFGSMMRRTIEMGRQVTRGQMPPSSSTPTPPPSSGGGAPPPSSGRPPAGSRQTTPYTPETIARDRERRRQRDAVAAARRAAAGGGTSGGSSSGASSGGGGGSWTPSAPNTGIPMPPAVDETASVEIPDTSASGFSVSPTMLAVGAAGVVGLVFLLRRRH